MNLTTLNRRLVIRKKKIDDEKVGGIYMPKGTQSKFTHGFIVSRADDCNANVMVGKEVIILTGSGMSIDLQDAPNEYLLINENEIIGIINE